MSHPDPLLPSRKHRAYAENVRHPVIDGDAWRIESYSAISNLHKQPISLTPEEVDEQIRQFFASDRL